MARGDPVFTKFDNNIRHSKKLHKLEPDERWVYVALNIICTEERTDVLLGQTYATAKPQLSPSYLAAEAHVDRRIALRALRHMAEVGLIELTDKLSVFVYDVMDRHHKLMWKERPIWPPNGETLFPQTRPENASLQRSEYRVQSIHRDPDTETVTQKPAPVPPDPPSHPDRSPSEKSVSPDEDPEPWNHGTGPLASSINTAITGIPNMPPNPELGNGELEREMKVWFLNLWPHGPYDWDAEKASIMSVARKIGRGPFNTARVRLLEDRDMGKIRKHEISWVIGESKRLAAEEKTGRC